MGILISWSVVRVQISTIVLYSHTRNTLYLDETTFWLRSLSKFFRGISLVSTEQRAMAERRLNLQLTCTKTEEKRERKNKICAFSCIAEPLVCGELTCRISSRITLFGNSFWTFCIIFLDTVTEL